MKRILFLILICLFLISCQKEKQVCFEDNCFTVEVADDNEERMLGLMHRENLDRDRGMLFIFDRPENYPFWMKNTMIPLDMIWMDENKVIVSTARNVPPCTADPCPSYNPNAIALYVLEVNAGIADEIDINIGDRATW